MADVTCQSCGHEMGSLASFCNQCGNQLPEITNLDALLEKESYNEMVCHPFGHQFQKSEINAKFCSFCGISL